MRKILAFWVFLSIFTFAMAKEDTQRDYDFSNKETLLYAINTNNIELLEKLDELKIDFNEKLPNEKLPIFKAIYGKKNDKVARFLLSKNVNINLISEYGKTIFDVAIENNFSEEFLKLLIEKGFDLDLENSENIDAYSNIMNNPNNFSSEFLEHIINKMGINHSFKVPLRNTTWTPLFTLVSNDNLSLFKELIKKGANINYVDEDGLDLFYFAIYLKKLEFAKELIDSGFKPNLNPISKRNPLAISVLNNDLDSFNYLLSLGFNPKNRVLNKANLLYFIITSPNEDLNRPKGMEFYVNLDTFDRVVEIFKDELNYPKDLGYHNTVLLYGNSLDYLNILFKYGLNVHLNNNGYSPLQFAIPNKTIIELLISKKINLNNQDKDGDTPLHEYVIWYEEVLNNIEKQKSSGYTKLENIKEGIDLLIKNGAKKSIKNKNKMTPYELAKSKNIKDENLLYLLK